MSQDTLSLPENYKYRIKDISDFFYEDSKTQEAYLQNLLSVILQRNPKVDSDSAEVALTHWVMYTHKEEDFLIIRDDGAIWTDSKGLRCWGDGHKVLYLRPLLQRNIGNGNYR